jgi:hypothetical protein
MIRPVAWINIRQDKWTSKGLKNPDNAYFFEHERKKKAAKESSKKRKKFQKRYCVFLSFRI